MATCDRNRQMTKIAAFLAATLLIVLIGGTAVYVGFAPRSALASCGISSGPGNSTGGPFELVSTDGETVTDADVLDRPSLIYFGYTFCPDICPFDVARNALVVDLLEQEGLDVGLVFITIDPERDTPEVLASYADAMHPRMTALTGSDQQIKALTRAYQVHAARGEGEGEFYLMDHSTWTYLMFPGNRFGGVFPRNDSAETIAEKSACLINSL